MKISLCLIVGNEAEIITRCLDSFADAFDELVLVEARGSLPVDNTAGLAKDWCGSRAKGFVHGVYQNNPREKDCPHVDDFAAARNLSFSLATGDWLGWCDADDLIDRPKEIRACCERTKDDCLFFPYNVPGTNKDPVRERFIRRSLWEAGRRWHYAVHENLKLCPGDKSEAFNSPAWIHAPIARKTEPHARNLRILHRQVEDMGAHCFYLHQEFYLMRDRVSAGIFGGIALNLPRLEQSFRYEILLNVARMADNPRDKMENSAKAFAVMPHCREAMASMILTSLEVQDIPKALSLSERLVATPEPPLNARPWTHEKKWYGWAGWDLRARVLRLAGRHEDAGYAQTMATCGRPVISLIHASMGNPQEAYKTRQRWLDAAAKPHQVQHVFAYVKADAEMKAWVAEFECAEADKWGPETWNAGAAVAKGHLLVQLADGAMPCFGWDEELIAALKKSGKDVTRDPIAVRTGATSPVICSRWRWHDQGRAFIVPDFWRHATDAGIVIWAQDAVFQPSLDPRAKVRPWQTSTSPNSTPISAPSAPSATAEKPSCMPVELQPFTESSPPKKPTLALNLTVGMMTERSDSTSTAEP